MSSNLTFRHVKLTDAADIASIYKPYVLETALTLELKTPTESNTREKILKVTKNYPFIVCWDNNKQKVIGYAYASRFRQREAYDYACESSIYVSKDCREREIGSRLYNILVDILKLQGYMTVVAVASAEAQQTLKFHKKMGFDFLGNLNLVGWKLNEWHDRAVIVKNINDEYKKPSTMVGKIIPITDKKILVKVQSILDAYNYQNEASQSSNRITSKL